MNFEVNIKLSYVDSLLSSVDIYVTAGKQAYQFNFEHPLTYFVKQLNQYALVNNLDNKDLSKLLTFEPSEEKSIESDEVHKPQEEEKVSIPLNPEIAAFLSEVEKGLLLHEPELCSEGVNGTYFMKNANGDIMGIFKPKDEEGDSLNNPKNSDNSEAGQPMHGIKSGEAAEREVAAYLLDHKKFFGVPMTTMAKFQHSSFKSEDGIKEGSLQQFIENEGASWDIGPSVFPVNEVHKIGLLDLYIMNTDRHGGNILFKENESGQYELIPIDNGFSLPDTISIPNLWFEWMNWSQAKKPFDEQSKKFIQELNVEEDIALIQKHLNIRPECLATMRIMGNFIKKGVAAGLTLHELGSIVCAKPPSKVSRLEEIINQVNQQCGTTQSTSWFEAYCEKLDQLFAK